MGSGTLMYAKDLARLASFYRQLLSMTEVHATDELVVLGDDVAIKPFFAVASFAKAQARASSLGGALFGPQYQGPGFRLTNAHDPEGNIMQLREPTGSV